MRRAVHSTRLVSVVVGLVRTVDGETEVVGLLGREGGELDVELGAVGSGDLLVERLREHAVACQRQAHQAELQDLLDTKRVRRAVGPEGDLGHDLVGERAGHDCEVSNRELYHGTETRTDRTRGGRYRSQG